MTNHRRHAQEAPYREAAYRQLVDMLRAHPTPCACGNRALSPDHRPALALHRHVPGTGCCRLVPVCRRCQYAGGPRVAARRRVGRRPNASRAW